MATGKYKRTNKNIVTMTKKNPQDAGLDICANENIIVPAKQSKLIHTGLYLEIPENHVGLVWSRSGIAVKNGIEVGAGCIDANYRGEIKVLLHNLSDMDFEISVGQRIAQLLTIPININLYQEVDDLSETDRGNNGFGSTGIS